MYNFPKLGPPKYTYVYMFICMYVHMLDLYLCLTFLLTWKAASFLKVSMQTEVVFSCIRISVFLLFLAFLNGCLNQKKLTFDTRPLQQYKGKHKFFISDFRYTKPTCHFMDVNEHIVSSAFALWLQLKESQIKRDPRKLASYLCGTLLATS